MANKSSIKIRVEDIDEDAEIKPKKPAERKTAAKKAAPKKPAERKTAAKKAAPKKAAERKTATVKVIDEDNEPASGKKKIMKSKAASFVHSELDLEEPVIAKKTVLSSMRTDLSKKEAIDPVKNVIADSLMEEEEKEMASVMNSKLSSPRSVKAYRRIAYFFIALTLGLVAAVFYFMFVKVTIVLIPNQERISNNMIFDIYDAEAAEEASADGVVGIVKQVRIEHKDTYAATGKEVIGKDATGQVTIYNSYIKNQPLVATTRLLSSDGVLFRIRNTVNVPAGGSAEVEIYADDPKEGLKVSPTKFAIPGLWAGLQEKIYAESQETIEYKEKVELSVTAEDIENSIRDLKQKLLAQAKTEINEIYKEYGQIIYKIDEDSIDSKVDAKPAEEIDEFSASMEAMVTVVAFDGKKAADLAKQKFISSLAENKELISFEENSIIYSLNNYDHVNGVATINATFEGKVSLRENSEIVDINKILGLNKEQLDAYLSSLPEIAGFEVNFYPSFFKKVPKLNDRVKIEIRK